MCLSHSTYHTEWDPRAVLPEAWLQFSLGEFTLMFTNPWFPLSSDVCPRGPCPTIFDSILITVPGENSTHLKVVSGNRDKAELHRGPVRDVEPGD